MHTLTFSILLFLSITQSHSMIAQSLNGEYRLTGIPETASAFRFTRDGHFDFFFIYGAVDRSSSGTYSTDGKMIKLTSEKVAGKDFPITKESKKGNHYTIQVNDANSYLVRNIICIYHIGEEKNVAYSDDHGQITIDAPHVDTIYLMHELFPDVPSLIKEEKNTNNFFEVSLSPSLGQVSFQGIDFTIDGNSISCLPNYILPFNKIEYKKQ